MTGLSDEEFVGYTFNASPERRARLWFLDRHLERLFLSVGWTVSTQEETWSGAIDVESGTWTLIPPEGKVYLLGHVRYEHYGAQPWTAVWRLTDTTIPHITTFGRDDVWRLGIWPD